MRYLGIDYGDKHIGLAIGDDDSKLALPLITLVNAGAETLCSDISRVCSQENIDTLVIGVPGMGSVFVDQRKKIESVVYLLRRQVSAPVMTVDESFTSREARHLIHEQGKRVGESTDEHALAAMLILQSYFDKSQPSTLNPLP
ncbi:Holliday junction resolvase RuvX [Candidatus Uhrbacteria bacterium]|nr:Holliday junction resolvase RuvX [Candidatus Uhrbacteria bacterium]